MHYSMNIPQLSYKRKRIGFTAIFDKSCRYNLNGIDQEDINKLYGICWGFNPHKNSYRIGWNYDLSNDIVRIYSYWYQNVERKFKEICSCIIGESVQFEIVFDRNFGAIYTTVRTLNMPKAYSVINYNFNKVSNFSYRMNPYFGGNQVCDHDVVIYFINEY